MREDYYKEKSSGYGIGQTRLRKIMELVGKRSGQRILDVGCSTGYLGARLKKNSNYVAGVEISSVAAVEAQKVLDAVFVFDTEKDWPEDLAQQKFDTIILAEIVEHVFDPVAVLRKAREILNTDGSIVITTPNILTWTNRFKMLFGYFRYTNQGLLDFGHIRLFTYKYLKEVISDSGLKIQKENHIIFPGKLTKILRYWPSLFASQFVVEISKKQ